MQSSSHLKGFLLPRRGQPITWRASHRRAEGDLGAVRAGRRTAQELRQAIDCLPKRTREAMLDGIGVNEIIVGAYTDRDGRVCPMLAAHRHGGRTSLAFFAKAWGRYTGARRPRPATERELRTLRAMLEASLMYQDEVEELAKAAAEHRELVGDAAATPKQPTGETSRLKELRHRAGWAWMRVFRRYDDYAAALAQLESEERAASAPPADADGGRSASRERELV